MKNRFFWIQLLRLLVMVVAVAAILYALEYMPASPWMWVSVGVLLIGFMMMLFAFRIAQRRNDRGADSRRRKTGKR